MGIFLSILLTVLKVILVILLVLLFIILLVLFVPIKYRLSGCFYSEDTYDFKATVSWLFKIIFAKFDLKAEDKLSIRIFGIKLKINKGNKEEYSDKKAAKTSDKYSKEAKNYKNEENTISLEPKDKKQTQTEDLTYTIEDKEEKEDRLDIKDCESEKEQNTNEKEKKNDFYDKIMKYIEIIKSKSFDKAFSLIKKKVGVILKIILPRKWQVNIVAGFEDPSITGSMIGISSMLYPIIARHINVKGDFTEKHIDIDGYFNGRITIIRILIVLLCVYFNKNIRRVMRMFKEVK